MKRVFRISKPSVLLMFAAMSISAQDEASLKRYFEGHRVQVKIDMPATKDGVDVYPRQSTPLRFREYSARLKQHGVAIHAGDSAMVTLVKAKDKVIEFQLGGGGYGTLADDTSTEVYVPGAGKTKREQNLEDALKKETDKAARRKLEEDLSDLRRDRDREDARLRAASSAASEMKREAIRNKALQAGSRFNLRFESGFLREIEVTPELVMKALRDYVDFNPTGPAVPNTPAASTGASQPGGVLIGLRKGMSRAEVLRLLGQPASSSQRVEGSLKVATLAFEDAENHIEADFLNDVLIRYRINSR